MPTGAPPRGTATVATRRYHTVVGTFHKGTAADCALCKSKARKTAAEMLARNKATGKLGGNVTAKKIPPRRKKLVCSECGKKIHPGSITGLCLACYNAKRARERQSDKERAARKRLPARTPAPAVFCTECGKKISGRGTTGLCAPCVQKHPNVVESRNLHRNLIGVMLHKNDVALPGDDTE